MPTEAGWYNDPWNEAQARFHDGGDWTGHTVVKADWAGRGSPPTPGAPQPVPAFRQAPAVAPPSSYAPPPMGRREGRADGRAEKAREKALRPWYQKKRFLIPIGVVVIGGLASAAGGGDDDKKVSTNTDAEDDGAVVATDSEKDDVTIVNCGAPSYGTTTISLTVVNNSSKASDYIIDIGIVDASGAKVGEGFASTDNVAPGQTANIDGYGTVSDASVGAVSCTVDDVERFASS